MQSMINKTADSNLQPFSGLTPEVVLDAAAAAGLDPDGRLFALNSYENRVYQVQGARGTLVLKFYRPARWSDAQIGEEHELTAELAAAELPVAAPLAIDGTTLVRYREFRFACFPWMRGRAPELDAADARQILGRSLARLHQIGALRPFAARPRLGIQRLGWEARTQVLASELLPEALRERYSSVSGALLERVTAGFAAAGAVGEIRIHGDCHLGNLLWNEHGPAYRICG
jgi:Ser/Thr protein kinase RdoA (MazF antagonist)